jgi:hypothetical protein
LANPFFSRKAELVEWGKKYFADATIKLHSYAKLRAEKSSIPGTVDPSTGLLIEWCNHLADSATSIYTSNPHSSFAALYWLQNSFFLCRAFGSEKMIEKDYEFPKKRAGDVIASGSGRSWSVESAANTMFNENLNYGTFTFNHELHARIKAEIDAQKFVHALVLICDPAKHGVLSPILNFVYTAHPEDIYALGFQACTITIFSFLESVCNA